MNMFNSYLLLFCSLYVCFSFYILWRTQIVKFSSVPTADKLSSNAQYNNLETYSILWIDPLVNDAKEYIDAQQRLRASINYIKTYKNGELCEEYIQSVPIQDRIIFIVNHQLGQELIPRIHICKQIFSIYIYSRDQRKGGQWTKEFKKVKNNKWAIPI